MNFQPTLLKFNVDANFLIQIFLLVVLVLYIGYSALLYKQLLILNKNFSTPKGPLLNIMGLANLLIASGLFLYAIILRLI